MINNKLKR